VTLGLTYGELTQTSIGPISFSAGDRGLQRITFKNLKSFKNELEIVEDQASLLGLEVIGALLSELNEYLFGIRKTFSVEIDWDILEGFQKDVLTVCADIPYGKLATYGGIANKLGKPGASRAVGRALGSNPMPIIIPCHRVIGADGHMRGYTDGIQTKAFLLALEGHQVTDGKIVTQPHH
jgi:methylated-DNA-[protein]-cysteine S-methyltransferase